MNFDLILFHNVLTTGYHKPATGEGFMSFVLVSSMTMTQRVQKAEKFNALANKPNDSDAAYNHNTTTDVGSDEIAPLPHVASTFASDNFSHLRNNISNTLTKLSDYTHEVLQPAALSTNPGSSELEQQQMDALTAGFHAFTVSPLERPPETVYNRVNYILILNSKQKVTQVNALFKFQTQDPSNARRI